MSRVRHKNTKPELVVRRLVHKLGYRFRLHRKDLPGTPDLVFKRLGKIVFVHGCFWHRHSKAGCPYARLPKSRLEFWLPKLNANRVRDRRHLKALRAAGWKVFIAWECELRQIEQLENNLQHFLEGNRAGD